MDAKLDRLRRVPAMPWVPMSSSVFPLNAGNGKPFPTPGGNTVVTVAKVEKTLGPHGVGGSRVGFHLGRVEVAAGHEGLDALASVGSAVGFVE